MYLRLVLSFVLTSPKFLHKALSRAYAEREYMSLRFAHTVSWFSRQSQHIIFEPPPSFRASGGVCRSRACQLNICSTIYKTPYNIFARGTPMGVSFAFSTYKFVETMIKSIDKMNLFMVNKFI